MRPVIAGSESSLGIGVPRQQLTDAIDGVIGNPGEHHSQVVLMDQGRKRVLAIVVGILVARHLKTAEDLGESRPSPRTECPIASAVQWADRIMTRIDGVFGNSPANGKR
jgi:hypothetical protein